MEFIVGALVVVGFLAILTRFVTRDGSGEVRLPRIVDDSIGMWTLRRMTGRRLGERAWDDEIDGSELDPNASDATRAALGALAAASAASSTIAPARNAPTSAAPARRAAGPAAPARAVARRRQTKADPVRSGSLTSLTPVLDLRRRQEAQARRRRSPWPRRLAVLGSIALLLIVAVLAGAALGSALQPPARLGQVLAATGRPQLASDSAQGAVTASRAPQSAPPLTVSRDVTFPKATITGLTKGTIVGSSKLRVTLTWTLTDSGSGLRSQLLQRRIDGGSWVTVSRASVSIRKAAFAMAGGHTYTFRIRGTNRSGNVGLFVSKSIRI